MIDYDPRQWQSTRLHRGFNYMMMFDPDRTLEKLKGVKVRMCDRRFYKGRKQRGDKWYYGRMRFVQPLDLWDAMEAGLVPAFREQTIREGIEDEQQTI